MAGFVRELSRVRFTFITGVNTLFNALLHTPGFDKLDFSSLKVALGGGMAVQAAVSERWRQVTGRHICQGWGLTESSPVGTSNLPGTTDFTGSIGYPLPSTEISIRDDDGNALPAGSVGEICLRGPQVMRGYWNRPDETAKVMLPGGWLRTGDIGRMDERGRTFIEDRKKDMILVSGFNVYPNEVEGVVAQMPGVLEVAAVAQPDEKSGEVVALFIVKKDPALTERAGRRLLPARADRLQAAARDLLPGRTAEIQRRQDPAPHAARRAARRLVVLRREIVHGRDHRGHMIRVRLRLHAVSQVEHVAGPAPVALEHARDLAADRVRRFVQQQRVEIALQRDAVAGRLARSRRDRSRNRCRARRRRRPPCARARCRRPS